MLIDTLSDQSGREIIFGDFDIMSAGPRFTSYTQNNLLYQYWSQKGGQQKRISRDHINPSELKPALKHIVMMDILPGKSPYIPKEIPLSAQHDFALQVRLIGTFVSDFYGEITGKDIYQMPHPTATNRIYHMSALAKESQQPQLSVASGYTPGKDHLKAYGLYLPLFNHDQQTQDLIVDKILVFVDVVTLHDKTI